ncbi:hypothetical protein [[Mycoplasma] testudinis]|uniref:hypothetical protein n=1 Tax=[Mycoplasma] testudinis TaxID=33924 RepID=UPI000487C27D|nr:hypothetical protein [[Mycoplasma] testudinis]
MNIQSQVSNKKNKTKPVFLTKDYWVNALVKKPGLTLEQKNRSFKKITFISSWVFASVLIIVGIIMGFFGLAGYTVNVTDAGEVSNRGLALYGPGNIVDGVVQFGLLPSSHVTAAGETVRIEFTPIVLNYGGRIALSFLGALSLFIGVVFIFVGTFQMLSYVNVPAKKLAKYGEEQIAHAKSKAKKAAK